jgi:phosphoglucosamine mutase
LLRFGTDGVRGVALTELTTDYVTALGAAAARVLGNGTWLIGRDTRQSGPALQDALVRGLRSEGALVVLCGVVPTPALAHFSATHVAPAAMITASHNPYSDNGVKIFAPGGVKLSHEVEAQIEAQLELGLGVLATANGAMPDGADVSEAGQHLDDAYVRHMISLFPEAALSGLRVVLDCANGAMSAVAPTIVGALGADVVVINAAPDGTNINARCGATHTGGLAAAVLADGADAGLAFDGDGDRVIAIDEHGHMVDGDRLIALGALQLRSEGALTEDTVVVTVMSNIGFHRAMRDAGIHVETTAVGDRYVLEALEAGDFAIGGEQSGHVIYRHLATTGDGLLAGLKLLQRVQASGRTLAELAGAVMTTYPQVLVNVRVAERHPAIAEELADAVEAIELELGENGGRVLLRASGTEPLIRVMVEATTHETATRLAEQLAEVVRRRYG